MRHKRKPKRNLGPIYQNASSVLFEKIEIFTYYIVVGNFSYKSKSIIASNHILILHAQILETK